MFLNFKTTALLLISTFAVVSAQAENNLKLEVGEYEVASGPSHLCANFEVNSRDLERKSIKVGDKYVFDLEISSHDVQSDLDQACKFKEQNGVGESESGEVILKRLNQEVCAGEVKSSTIAVATLGSEKVKLDFKIEGAEPFVCIWKKKQ